MGLVLAGTSVERFGKQILLHRQNSDVTVIDAWAVKSVMPSCDGKTVYVKIGHKYAKENGLQPTEMSP